MRFLAVWVSVITCIIVTLLRQVIPSLSPYTRKHILSSLQTLKDILNVCSLIHPGITLEPVLQPRTWVTPSRAFSMIESMAEAQRMSDILFFHQLSLKRQDKLNILPCHTSKNLFICLFYSKTFQNLNIGKYSDLMLLSPF